MKYYKNLSIDESDFSVQRQGCRIHLTTTEYQLFITLLDHSGHICSRNFLLASAWNITVPIQTRTVDVHIAKLRKKLDLGPEDLKTVMGRGYALSMHESCRANRSLWTSHYNKKGRIASIQLSLIRANIFPWHILCGRRRQCSACITPAERRWCSRRNNVYT